MQTVPFTDLQQYDKTIAKIDRKFWIRNCYDNYPESVVAMNGKHQICGYGVFYKMEGENRHVFQPILAENVQIAKKILTELLVKVPLGDKITIKIAKENVEGMELMKRIGLDIKSSECETGPVMFTKYQIAVPIHKVFSFMNGMNQPA